MDVRGSRPGRAARLLADADARVCATTGAIVAFDDKGGFEPASRQGVLPFDREPAAVRPLLSQSRAWEAFVAARDAGEVGQAQALLERYLQAFPTHAQAWVECGMLHHLRGALDSAVLSLREAIAHDDSARTRFRLGLVYEDLERDADALDAYAAAVALDPGLADAHFNAARVCERLGDRLRALRHLHAYRRTRR